MKQTIFLRRRFYHAIWALAKVVMMAWMTRVVRVLNTHDGQGGQGGHNRQGCRGGHCQGGQPTYRP